MKQKPWALSIQLLKRAQKVWNFLGKLSKNPKIVHAKYSNFENSENSSTKIHCNGNSRLEIFGNLSIAPWGVLFPGNSTE